MTDIIVYGKGKTGKSLMNMLQKLHIGAVQYDDETGFDVPTEFSSNCLVLVSPGVPPYAKGLVCAREKGATVVGELEYCFPKCLGRCISVTGTNGKTTVCEMIYHILLFADVKTRLLGNGGVPFSSQVSDVSKEEIVVLESSSFMLADCNRFAPWVSVLTNLAPDHINWHGSFDAYREAKKNNFIHQKSGYALFTGDDDAAVEMSTQCVCEKLFYSVNNDSANCFFDGENVVIANGTKIAKVQAAHFKSFAEHNLSNALAAVLACCCVGVLPDVAVTALENFVFPPHRLQSVGCIKGVNFVDDSKATNVHATVSALKSIKQNFALIVGGSDKGENYGEIFKQANSHLKAVVAVGQTAKDIALCGLKYGVKVEILSDIKDAVRYCYRLMEPIGGTVLMSNACASFDSFRNFEERGDYFLRAVEELKIEIEKN